MQSSVSFSFQNTDPRHLKSFQSIFNAQISQEKPNKMGPTERDILSSLLYGFSIIVEIADRVVDGFILTKHEAGEISND